MITYLLIFGVFMQASWLVSQQLKSRFKKYSLLPMNNGYTGRDIAEKMLRENGIIDVKIMSVSGELTDHYNPLNKTVNLSREVYFGNHIAAGAVSAHECGHAIQHANSYSWLQTANVTSYSTHLKAQDALKWAAYTYVVAALGSLATLLYYIMIYLGRRE